MKVRCPHCGKQVEYEGNPFRPFCSQRCRLIDLGKWINEEYRIPALEDEKEKIEESDEGIEGD